MVLNMSVDQRTLGSMARRSHWNRGKQDGDVAEEPSCNGARASMVVLLV